VPWENVLVYEDVAKSNSVFQHSGFFPRAMFQDCARLAVKLDFIAGLLIKAVAAVGSETIRVLTLQMAQGSGRTAEFTGFAEPCMAEYNLEGWTASESLFLKKRPSP
jgi:hypothetical protein